MISTKILGLTAALSKSKKLKIALLLAEVALFAIALRNEKKTPEKEDESIKIEKENI
jgi:hypothetical protein|tara:strand:+ start:245 stop:415 length:171 start_codon:yes stop_codon:yes gene_type:complete